MQPTRAREEPSVRPAAETGPGPGGGEEWEVLLACLRGLLGEIGHTGVEPAADADLERDLGLGSLERAELLARLGDAFGVVPPDEAVHSAHTPAELIALLRPAAAAAPAPAPAPAADLRARAPAAVVPPAGARTLIEVARFRAEHDGGRTHLEILSWAAGAPAGEAVALSYEELWRGALRVASGLGGAGLAAGDRVALMLPSGADFFLAYLGVLCAGGVPVPVYPPVRLARLGAYLDRQARLLDDAGARLVLCDRPLARAGGLLAARTRSVRGVEVVAELAAAPEAVGPARAADDALAVIQYSSGSTGEPKGVALAHRAVLANVRAIGETVGFRPEDVGVSWLPLYHDLGLIASWLTCLYHGVPLVSLSPLAFLARPERWLQAISRYRGSASAAPNFAYDLCAHRVPDAALEGLDLSSWRAAMIGAEPVRPETLEAFIGRFERCGFERGSLLPVYGLAETAVALTVTPPGRGPLYDDVDREMLAAEGRARPASGGGFRRLVSCGRPIPGHEVRVAAAGEPVPALGERRIGRIEFRGPSTMEGYFGRPEATAAVRRADGWIDTGDLGYLAGGELFVTGRVKDLLIVAGRNYDPQDLERAAESVPGVRKGCTAAFAVDGAEREQVVLLVEVRRPAAGAPGGSGGSGELERAVTAAVLERVGIAPDRVVTLPPRTLPKTSSGKLRRAEARRRHLEGSLRRRRARPAWLEAAAAAPALALRALARGTAAAGSVLLTLWALVAALLILVPWAALMFSLRRAEARWWAAHRGLRSWGRATGLLPRISGPPLPAGGVVVVSNHASYLDALVLIMAFERPVRIVSKHEVFGLPVAGPVMRHLEHLPLDRGSAGSRLEGYGRMLAALRRGAAVHLFPEATFTRAGGIRSLRLGAFSLAVAAGVPVVPVVVRGTRRVLGDGRVLLRPGRIEIERLPPLPAPEGEGFRAVLRLRDATRRLLAEVSGEPLLDVSPTVPPEARRGS